MIKSFISWMEALPLWAKILFAIPALDVVWVVYRLCRSVDKNNLVGALIAGIAIVVGLPIVWLIDIICILMNGNVWWID